MGKVSEKEKEQLIEQFLPRVKYYASRYAFYLPHELSIEDLVSAGIVGLLSALVPAYHAAKVSIVEGLRYIG